MRVNAAVAARAKAMSEPKARRMSVVTCFFISVVKGINKFWEMYVIELTNAKLPKIGYLKSGRHTIFCFFMS